MCCSPTRAVQLHDLRDDFAGNEYRARWHAAELIQRNARAALARWGVARALMGAWTKEYDDQAERYTFIHKKKGDTQYHKPWGMGTVDLWASPEEKVDEVLLSLFLGIEVGIPIYGHKVNCFTEHRSYHEVVAKLSPRVSCRRNTYARSKTEFYRPPFPQHGLR